MHSRVAALTEELVSTFKLAVGDTLSLQEMLDLHKFCYHFGDVDIRYFMPSACQLLYFLDTSMQSPARHYIVFPLLFWGGGLVAGLINVTLH